MATERLHYADAYLTAFTARVTARGRLGDHPAVALDRTAFYPEGGGQPADHGRLNDVEVLDVQVTDGVVWHAVSREPDRDDVEGHVDWARRFDHMQQHHGQHLLSAAFERLHEFRTVSFHLGPSSATIDLATATLTDAQAHAAEDLTNQVIWEDRPVTARFVTPDELAVLPLRKPPAVEGPIRVVSVPDFDHSACGGTHPRSTGAVGLVHLRRWERRGGETRVEFVCGGRAAADLRRKTGVLSRVSAGLSVGLDELEAAVARARESEQTSRKRLDDTMERLAAFEAAELLAAAPRAGGIAIVRQAYRDRTAQDLRLLAAAISERGGVALLGLEAAKGHVLFASPPGSAVDCGRLLRECVAAAGGKGGGQPNLAQGGMPDPARVQQVLAAALEKITGGS